MSLNIPHHSSSLNQYKNLAFFPPPGPKYNLMALYKFASWPRIVKAHLSRWRFAISQYSATYIHISFYCPSHLWGSICIKMILAAMPGQLDTAVTHKSLLHPIGEQYFCQFHLNNFQAELVELPQASHKPKAACKQEWTRPCSSRSREKQMCLLNVVVFTERLWSTCGMIRSAIHGILRMSRPD